MPTDSTGRIAVSMPVYAVQWCDGRLYVGGGGGSAATGVSNTLLRVEQGQGLEVTKKLDMGMRCIWGMCKHPSESIVAIAAGDGFDIMDTDGSNMEITSTKQGIEVKDGDDSAMVCAAYVMIHRM